MQGRHRNWGASSLEKPPAQSPEETKQWSQKSWTGHRVFADARYRNEALLLPCSLLLQLLYILQALYNHQGSYYQ